MSLLAATTADSASVSERRVSRAHGLRRRCFEVLERAEPGDRLSQVADVLLVTLIVLSATAIVLESIGSLYVIYGRYFFLFEAFTVSVFTVEYLLRL